MCDKEKNAELTPEELELLEPEEMGELDPDDKEG